MGSVYGEKTITDGMNAAGSYMEGLGVFDAYELTPEQFDCLIVEIVHSAFPHEDLSYELNINGLEKAKEESAKVFETVNTTNMYEWNYPMFRRLITSVVDGFVDGQIPF